MNTVLRTLRIVHGAMMAAAFIYVGLAETLNAGRPPCDIKTMYVAIAIQTFLMVAISLFLRGRLVTQGDETLRVDANNSAALTRWRAGQITSFAFAESVVLFGLVLRFVGASRAQAIPLYIIGILMFVLFYPRQPEDS